MTFRDKLKKLLSTESFYTWVVFLALLFQGIIIFITSVNVPQGDEWEMLRANGFPDGFDLKYIFAFHNEHRIVFTKLINYLFFIITGWNLKYQIIFNYGVFCALVGFLYLYQKKHIPSARKGIWILPFFLASPLLVDNHNWGFQSCFHFFLLFGLLGMMYATQKELKRGICWLAAIFALFSLYSLAAGMFFCIVIFLVLAYRILTERENILNLKVPALGLILGGIGYWFVGYQSPGGHPAWVLPTEWGFWKFFGNLISLGFGYKTPSLVIAFLSLGVVILVMSLRLRKAFSFNTPYVSFALFSSLAVLGALSSIALSRAGYGIGQAKTSRYSEIGILLAFFIAWLLWDLSYQYRSFKRIFSFFIGFLLIGFSGTFSYSTYFSVSEDRAMSLTCVLSYYSGENKSGMCPSSYPGPLNEFLENAKKLKLSWVGPQ